MKTKEAYQQGLRTYLILKNYMHIPVHLPPLFRFGLTPSFRSFAPLLKSGSLAKMLSCLGDKKTHYLYSEGCGLHTHKVAILTQSGLRVSIKRNRYVNQVN